MRGPDCPDARLSGYRKFNHEFGIVHAELLNDASRRLQIVQPCSAPGANIVWIGHVDEKLALHIG